MAKICKESTCNLPVFGGGYCTRHQYRRTDKKKKPIPKRSTRESVKSPSFGYDSQIQMFKHMFFSAKKPIICPISGRDITDIMDGRIEQWVQMFAHILPKKNYTYWRLNPRNVRMINPVAHHILDNGTKEDREKHPDWNWEWWDKEVRKAKRNYRAFCKSENL